MRKLATVRRISNIKSIENANAIEVAFVDGWECVCKKNEFKIGDKIVYIEIDSIVPERPEFEFLRNRKFRIRTIKLRGQISQGLILPLSVLPPNKEYKINDDVTEILGITKYDPQAEQENKLFAQKTSKTNPLIKFFMKFKLFRRFYIKPKRGGFPAWISKTDEERIQNKVGMFKTEKELGTKFVVTEKIDGQSGTFFLEKVGRKYKFGVCSRNVNITNDPNHNGSYWKIAKQLDIENVLRQLIGKEDRIVLQGEIVGERIQGNKYRIKGYDFYAFNLIYPNRKIPTKEMAKMLKPFNIKSVMIIEENFELKNDIAEMVDYAKGNSLLLPSQKREGVVIRSFEKNISFKVINPDFLLAEKD